MKRILDPSFRYVNAASTDIRKTFERIRRERKAEDARKQHDAANVAPIRKVKA